MHPPGPEHPRAARLPAILSGLCLIAAAGWLVSRVWVGLDFTDEMQYYGEIASLTRTGRFFQDDMFLQQLGYVFVWPFFKLHALVFPGLDFLVLSGRLLLLAAYGATAALFWRAATRHGLFSTAQKLAGLAAFFAWVPFQIFAFSYNTTSYLLIVALVAVWIGRDPDKYPRYAWSAAVLLTGLTYTHPPAGLALILTAGAEAGWRLGLRAAVRLLLTTALAGLAVGGVIISLHGASFLTDLAAAVNFTRSYGSGLAIWRPDNLAGWLIMISLAGLFIWRLRRDRAFRYPWSDGSPTVLWWAGVCLFVAAGGALLGLIINWKTSYVAVSVYLGLLLVLAASVDRPTGQPPALRIASAPLMRWMLIATLMAGITALLTILTINLRPGTGYFAMTLYQVLLTLLALRARPGERNVPIGLAVVGTVAGAVFAFTSGNGLHNFGIGAAGLIPFLVLYCARWLEVAEDARTPALTAAILSGFVGLLLLNGVLHPYAEQKPWNRFSPVQGVPAFRGLWTSPVKIEMLKLFQTLSPPGALEGKRVLVIGPQPWLYFALGGQPATPMFFMHFDGLEAADKLIATQLFRGGMPDIIVLAKDTMPRPIADRIVEWARNNYTTRSVVLPARFNRPFQQQTGYLLADEVFLLERKPGQP